MKRTATAVWKGSGLEGSGEVKTRSGAIQDLSYTHKTRFANEDGKAGSNPEELLAAAHAACFNMALSFQINGAGFNAESLETVAQVIMDQQGYDYTVAQIILSLKADVPGISTDKLLELAEVAKNTCPISQALKAVDIILNVET